MTRPVHALVLVIAAALAACGGSLPSEALIEKESRQGLATLEVSLRERVRDDPDDYAALRLLALTQLRLEKPGEAELNALRATRAGPFVAANAVTLGRVYEAQQKRLRALTVYGHAIELDPGRISAYVRYALVQERLGNPAEALETLAQALLREPRHFAARFHQARLLLARGDLDAAARAAEQARRVRPRERESLLLLVAVYRAQGRLAGARLLAEQALELHPGDRALLAALLAVHRERARWSEARSVLQRLREAGRLSPEERLLEAEVLRGEGRPRDARAALERLIRDAPRFPPARIRMARLLIAEGRHREAIGSCEEAVALAPRAAQAYYWKAVAHFHLDQSELGEAALSLAERLRPGNRALRLLRIARLLAEQRIDAAGSRLEAYREEYPRDPALSLLAAEYHALSGDATRADAELAALAPNFAPDAVRALVEEIQRKQELYGDANRAALARLARERGLPIASHDDATAEHVEEAERDGVTLAEFPTTVEAARAARTATLHAAQAVGMNDRGALAPGLRADLIAVHEAGGVPRLQSVWIQGRRVV